MKPMPVIRVGVLALLAAAFASSDLPAQEPLGGDVNCRWCRGVTYFPAQVYHYFPLFAEHGDTWVNKGHGWHGSTQEPGLCLGPHGLAGCDTGGGGDCGCPPDEACDCEDQEQQLESLLAGLPDAILEALLPDFEVPTGKASLSGFQLPSLTDRVARNPGRQAIQAVDCADRVWVSIPYSDAHGLLGIVP